LKYLSLAIECGEVNTRWLEWDPEVAAVSFMGIYCNESPSRHNRYAVPGAR
jgi:hypothetical protein